MSWRLLSEAFTNQNPDRLWPFGVFSSLSSPKPTPMHARWLALRFEA